MAAQVEIFFADGTSQRFPLESEQVTLGSSPRAGIRIDDPALEPEHLLFAPMAEGCWVAVARGAQTPAYAAGQPFVEGTLSWGDSLSVGPITVRVHEQEARADKPSAVSLPVLLLALVGLPAALWMMLDTPERFELPERRTAAPELFAEKAPGCPDKGDPGQIARTRAQDAAARAERYPFDPADGIEAVRLYGEARACFRAAGEPELVSRVEAAAAAIRRTVEEDYKTHRVRLERALANRRYGDALVEARALLRFAGDHEDYRNYLVMLVRRLEMRERTK